MEDMSFSGLPFECSPVLVLVLSLASIAGAEGTSQDVPPSPEIAVPLSDETVDFCAFFGDFRRSMPKTKIVCATQRREKLLTVRFPRVTSGEG